MTLDDYRNATTRIPWGETRSYSELAAMAGKPGAARAAGRAIRGCTPSGTCPCHRVVASDGTLRDDEQLWLLRAEGARPRDGEAVAEWAQRNRAHFIGYLRVRHYTEPSNSVALGWDPRYVEALRSASEARARGFSLAGKTPSESPPIDRARIERQTAMRPQSSIEQRLGAIDWDNARRLLAERGHFRAAGLLAPSECAALIEPFDEPGRFERTIEMRPKGYGIGTYRYWSEPLPKSAGAIRRTLYSELRELAQTWREGDAGFDGYPETIEDFWIRCRAAGQLRTSCILLRYAAGGENFPHRDIYGTEWFPFQALAILSKRETDFYGGEFVMLVENAHGNEQRITIPADEGDLVIFASQFIPDGNRRRMLRHAMDPVTRGERFGMGLVLNTAR